MDYSSGCFVFDVQGLVQYPGFADEIIAPLENLGYDIRFWSHAQTDIARNELINQGLGGYVYDGLIDRNMYNHFFREIQMALQASRVSGRLGLRIVRNALNKVGAPYDDENTDKVLELGKDWMSLCHYYGVHLKCPWIFGKNSLLVESDGMHWSHRNPHELSHSSYLYEPNRAAAQMLRYSLLYTPEYPGIWHGHQPAFNEHQILALIKEYVMNWNGEYFTIPLGETVGLYKERYRNHPERE